MSSIDIAIRMWKARNRIRSIAQLELPRSGLVDTQDEGLALEMESDAMTAPVFPPGYKAEVFELIRTTGKTVGQVAKELV